MLRTFSDWFPPVLSLEGLILAKRASGRPKDLIALPELEALLEARHRS
jgi:hypothetical protein